MFRTFGSGDSMEIVISVIRGLSVRKFGTIPKVSLSCGLGVHPTGIIHRLMSVEGFDPVGDDWVFGIWSWVLALILIHPTPGHSAVSSRLSHLLLLCRNLT